MDISYDELDLLINKICLGKEISFLNNTFVTLTYPSIELRVRSEMIREISYQQALKEGLLPKADLEQLIIDRGLYSEEDAAQVSKLRSRLDAQEIILAKTLKVKANKDRLKKIISELQEEISVILYKKYSKMNMSADIKADEDVNNYLCCECVYLDTGKKYWSDLNDFLDCEDTELKNQIFTKFLELIRGRDMKVIRLIARSTLWRIKYTTSMKTSEKLFGIPVSDYTTDQTNLIYWANYYDQIYNMMPSDRPSEDVISDDDLLDKYMDEYYKEINNETSIIRERKAMNKGSLSAFDAEEVIVTQSNELYQEIEYDKPREASKLTNKENADVKGKIKKVKVDTKASRQSQGIK